MTYADATGSGTDVVSVLIPAHTEPYLQPTIDDVLAKAAGEVEVVVVLDGYWPDPPLAEHPNVVVIHHSDPRGMRECINIASSVASGRNLMKLDAHCMVAEGWDEVLKSDCDANTIMVPSRYGLDVTTWQPKRDKPPVEYLYLTWPYSHEPQFGTGMHGKKWCVGSTGPKGWWHLENERKDILIDDIMIWQGSCWFMHTDTFRRLGLLDCRYSYNMFQEANELSFKIWLSGGLVVNKRTWYAHYKNEPTGDTGGRQGQVDRPQEHRLLQSSEAGALPGGFAGDPRDGLRTRHTEHGVPRRQGGPQLLRDLCPPGGER